jgi:3-methylfumaryl-CoA hydratase
MTEHLDVELLRRWIGRTETTYDSMTPRLVQELKATLNLDSQESQTGSPAPLLAHWCLAPPAAPASLLGPDGHPQRGGFLPPVPLPQRMWAGGRLKFHDPLLVGDEVERRSKIAEVNVKEGRSGTLCFVTVEHNIFSPRGLAIEERQDIVYRALAPAAPSVELSCATWPVMPQWRKELRADSTLLFRYSALTFNGHRIHYDREYAMEQEFYPGLVVHGPLQATLLAEFAISIKGVPKQFDYRGISPLFDFQPFNLCAVEHESGLKLWVRTDSGTQTMEATSQ